MFAQKVYQEFLSPFICTLSFYMVTKSQHNNAVLEKLFPEKSSLDNPILFSGFFALSIFSLVWQIIDNQAISVSETLFWGNETNIGNRQSAVKDASNCTDLAMMYLPFQRINSPLRGWKIEYISWTPPLWHTKAYVTCLSFWHSTEVSQTARQRLGSFQFCRYFHSTDSQWYLKLFILSSKSTTSSEKDLVWTPVTYISPLWQNNGDHELWALQRFTNDFHDYRARKRKFLADSFTDMNSVKLFFTDWYHPYLTSRFINFPQRFSQLDTCM